MTMNSTYYGMNTCQAMPNDAKRSRPLGKKVAKKRRQAGLVADGRRASPRTNVIAVRCGPPADAAQGTVLPLPHCTFDFAGSMACSLARARRVEGDGRVEKEIHESRARTGQKLKNPANPPVRTHYHLMRHPPSVIIRRACRPCEATAATDRSAACTAQERTI